MDLGTKVLLISGGFFLLALIPGLFGEKMSDDWPDPHLLFVWAAP